MKFTGQIRIPEVDHPGIPATVLVEDTQIEVVLDGESLGRWSLFDVRARRLISAAFLLDLDGEEITFIADEPMDFAYRGVEEMSETFARLSSMRALKRTMAVRSSRTGTKPSRVAELRAAMEANLQVERRGFLGRIEKTEVEEPPPTKVGTPAAESVVSEPQPSLPDPGETTGDDVVRMAAETAEAERTAERQAEEDRLAEERAKLEAERARLEGEHRRLEELRMEAEERDARRIEAFRMEMARLEAERAEHDRIEAERSTLFRNEMEKLRAERERLEALESERSAKAGEDAAQAEAVRLEMERLEEERQQMEQIEADRLAAAEREMEAVNAKRLELERVEAERVEQERAEVERLAQLEAEQAEAEKAELERLAAEQAEIDRLEAERAEDDAAAAEEDPAAAEEAETPAEEAETPEMVKEVQGTSVPPDDDSAKELVVDLGVYEDETPDLDPEPVLAAVGREKAGFMGAVKSAFTRGGGKNHEHILVEAPGGLGIVRSICRECGFVSISSSD